MIVNTAISVMAVILLDSGLEQRRISSAQSQNLRLGTGQINHSRRNVTGVARIQYGVQLTTQLFIES